MLELAIAFIIALYLDALWVVYLKALKDDRTLMAPAVSGLIMFSSMECTRAVVSSPHAVVGATLGAVFGTAAAMRWL